MSNSAIWPTRRLVAHIAATLSGSFLILVGIECVVYGLEGVPVGIGKWIGGLLIFAVFAIVTIPLGLALRLVLGKLPLRPRFGAIAGGVVVGFALVFVLHPALYPPLSFSSHPVSLTFIHLASGGLAGYIWYLIEAPVPERESL